MENGLVHIYYGDGKGKTTSAIGLGMRAAGNHLKVIMIQFLKGDSFFGEGRILKDLEPAFKVFRFEKNHGVSWALTDEERRELKSETKNALNFAAKVMDTAECDVLILDEVLSCVAQGIISETEMCDFIDSKPEDIELVLTGGTLLDDIEKRADYISHIETLKHPKQRGIGARKGIEF